MQKKTGTFPLWLGRILRRRPDAAAVLHGSPRLPELRGTVRFYQTGAGVLVAAEVLGLPKRSTLCSGGIFAFHIHEGGECGTADIRAADPFPGTSSHYNPGGCPHPGHAGDLPPLFGNAGYAVSVFLTDRFTVSDIVGRTAVIHERPDDFMTQPAGGSGRKIACGEIRRA